MADAVTALTWKLSEIKTRWRELTGLSTTGDIADATLGGLINDYYVNHFPEDAKVSNFDGAFTQLLAPTDSGEYSIDEAYVKLMGPMTVNGAPVRFFQDKRYFDEQYPVNEQYITAPGLAIGSSDTKAVLHAAFKYNISGYGCHKATSEVSFSGLSTVPQNKYGAFSLKIDIDGTVTIAEADDNETGYDTPREAIAGLAAADSDSAFMGFVTVISTDSGGFVPGTTALSAAAVTDTYTDGNPAFRGEPTGIYIGENKIFTGPKPDDWYEFKCLAQMSRPTAFTLDTDTPGDTKWGPMIALNCAILYLAEKGDTDRIQELVGGPFSLAEYRLRHVQRKKSLQNRGRVAEPNW